MFTRTKLNLLNFRSKEIMLTFIFNQLIFINFVKRIHLKKQDKMIAEPAEKVKKRHVGRNVQKIRTYFGVKQETLATDLGISQPEISKIENQEEIEEGLLSQIADVLGVSSELIRDFDEEKAVYNINNIRDNTFEQGSTSIAQFEQKDTTIAPQINPIEKVVELYERLLQSEREKIELLKDK